jgi:hypothetical protein
VEREVAEEEETLAAMNSTASWKYSGLSQKHCSGSTGELQCFKELVTTEARGERRRHDIFGYL